MKKKKKSFINKIIFLLFCMSIYLGFKINEKKQWITLPMISSWLPFENWLDLGSVPVSDTITYYHLVDDVYTNGSNTCVSLFDGIVLEVNETSISVLSDEGILVVYGELNSIVSKSDERIMKGQSMGVFENSLTLRFSKDNQEISYEEAMKL